MRQVTMQDVADSLNVSRTTVSKVINGHYDISDKMRKEVLDKIQEMGFAPNMLAVNLRRNKPNMVALVLSDVSKPYFSQVIQGYETTLEAAGYQAMIFSSMESGEREKRLIRMIASMNMAGIIIDPAQDSDVAKTALRGANIPYVFSNRFLDEQSDYYVTADNEAAGYMATHHLLERRPGRPVVCINGPMRISPTISRYAGYVRALEEAGMQMNPSLVYDNCFDLEGAYAAGIALAHTAKVPFSVFCSTDQFAVGVMRALHDSGFSIPQDVAVIGVDDIEMARYINPALTTVSLPKEKIGQMSAQMVIDLIEGRTVEEKRIMLYPELIIRETT